MASKLVIPELFERPKSCCLKESNPSEANGHGRCKRCVCKAVSIHKEPVTWCKVKRTNVFNNLWPWEASHRHTLNIHTHAHGAHYKYAFVPLLVRMGPGIILNVIACISISLLLAARGRGTQREAPDRQFMRTALPTCNTFFLSVRWQKEDKCARRRRGGIQRSCTERWRDKEIETQGRGGGGKVSDATLLSSTPLLQSPRQHACRAPVRCIITGKTTERDRGKEIQ